MGQSITGIIRNLVAAGQISAAEDKMLGLMQSLFNIGANKIILNQDAYALNSVNGTVFCDDGGKYFFKFHQEDGEEQGIDEYYNSKVLEKAGYPIDKPKWQSNNVGEQILVYEFKDTPRFSDICEQHELENKAPNKQLINAQEELDALTLSIYKKTYKTVGYEEVLNQPINQLFYWRLVKNLDDKNLGARTANFYLGKRFSFGNLIDGYEELEFSQIANLKWNINGISYCNTLQNSFDDAIEYMHPKNLAKQGAVTAHGDAHNANVWYNSDHSLSLYDPAFASENIPAILAEIKATFHNIFAHPFWLYNTPQAEKHIAIKGEIEGSNIHITHDWEIGALREEFLKSKTQFWIDWLSFLQKQGNLPTNWRKFIRIALFCCPSLVINMRANSDKHNYKTSLLALTICIMLSSEPESGTKNNTDIIKDFLDTIERGITS